MKANTVNIHFNSGYYINHEIVIYLQYGISNAMSMVFIIITCNVSLPINMSFKSNEL